jgi:deoxyadenosine/deoxycytidine kinase
MERSIYAARNCFTENLNNIKWLNNAEYKILDDLFQISTDKGSCHVDLFSKRIDIALTCKKTYFHFLVYLRTDPSKCMERLQARQRSEEATVPLSYLTDLHNLYEHWFCPSEKIVQEEVTRSLVIIDGNRTKEEVFEDAMAQLQNFLEKRRMA